MKKVVELLEELHPNFDFVHSGDFFADGYLDSFDLTRLIVQVEETYGIEIDGRDIRPESFQNLAAIQSMLGKYGVK